MGDFHQFRTENESETCGGRGGMLQRGVSSSLNMNWIRNMHWKTRDASETTFIDFEYELYKKHALEEEGCFREDFINFEYELNKNHALEEEECFREDVH